MKTTMLVLMFATLAMLCGCSQLQTQLDSHVNDALALTLPDLDAAHALAVAKNDPNPAHDLCWTGLATAIRAQIAAEPAATPATPAPVGIASAAEDLLTTEVSPLVVHLPPLAPGVKSACYATIGELRVKATTDAIKFSNSITATLHSLHL